jgi:FHA domain
VTAQSAPHARSASEIKSIIEAERVGLPFLLWRDHKGEQQIVSLDAERRMTMGRGPSCDLAFPKDGEISRIHAELESIGEELTITDDGLSRNGTFVNGARISGRKRLVDGDVVRVGRTVVEYRAHGKDVLAATSAASQIAAVEGLTDTQRKILVALCRPYKTGGSFATPASNAEVAAEVFLSVDAVKTHMRTLFRRFEISDLPQIQKRARLVECAFQWGLVSERDL